MGIESWDIARKRRIAHFDLGFDMGAKGTLSDDAELFALAFRPNAGIEGSVEVRTTATNHLVKKFVNQPYVTAIAFSADRSLVAFVGGRTAKVWDLKNQIEVADVEADVGTNVIAFSPRNRYVAFGGPDGVVRVVRLTISDLYAEACRRLDHNLAEPEWKQIMGNDESYQPTCPGLAAQKKTE
jgi:hypothetical protein